MGNFFWAAHDFGQVKLAQNWLWEAIGPSAPLNYPFFLTGALQEILYFQPIKFTLIKSFQCNVMYRKQVFSPRKQVFSPRKQVFSPRKQVSVPGNRLLVH